MHIHIPTGACERDKDYLFGEVNSSIILPLFHFLIRILSISEKIF